LIFQPQQFAPVQIHQQIKVETICIREDPKIQDLKQMDIKGYNQSMQLMAAPSHKDIRDHSQMLLLLMMALLQSQL
jgi:hypothetical protein